MTYRKDVGPLTGPATARTSSRLEPADDVPAEPWRIHGASSLAEALTKPASQPSYVPATTWIYAADAGRVAEIRFAAPTEAITGGAAWFFANTGPATSLVAQLVAAGTTVASTTVPPQQGFSWRSLTAPTLTPETASNLVVRFSALGAGDTNVRALYFDASSPTADHRVPAGGIPAEVYTDVTGWQNPWIKANEPWLDPQKGTLPLDGDGQWRSCAPWGQAICLSSTPGSLQITQLRMTGSVPGEDSPRTWTWDHTQIDMRRYCRFPWFASEENYAADRTDTASYAEAAVPDNNETFGVLHFYPTTRPDDLPAGLTDITVDADVLLSQDVIVQVGFDWYRYPVGGDHTTDHEELGAGYWYRSADVWQTAHLAYCVEPLTVDPPYLHCGDTPPWR